MSTETESNATPSTSPQKSDLLEFVESLFEASKEKVDGIYIKMDDGKICRVKLVKNTDDVTVDMSDVKMGRMEKYSGQGYQYAFYCQNWNPCKPSTPIQCFLKSVFTHKLIRLF